LERLGKNIRTLRKKENYSQIELAKSIGVSQTSIAHYEAGTRQPTIETLMELSQIFNEPIDSLVGNAMVEKSNDTTGLDYKDLVQLLIETLLSKNESRFMEIFHESVYPYYTIHKMADGVLKEVMYTIGTMWERGDINEADEHYATNIVRKVISYISFNQQKMLKNKKAITFTVGSEKHTLGLEMVNATLESEGIDSIYLGSNLPIKSIEEVIDKYKPQYIFISITMSDSLNSLVHIVDNLNEKYEDIIIGVGGQGLQHNEEIIERNNVHVLKDIDTLVELIKNKKEKEL